MKTRKPKCIGPLCNKRADVLVVMECHHSRQSRRPMCNDCAKKRKATAAQYGTPTSFVDLPKKVRKMYTYKDFVTGKTKRTRGKFHEWQRGGILNVWGAVFLNRCSALFIPFYCLTDETKQRIPPRPAEQI